MKVPDLNEIIGMVVVVLAIALVLKLARVAVRLMLFVVGFILVMGIFYLVFAR